MSKINYNSGFWLLVVLHALGIPGVMFLFLRLLAGRMPVPAAVCVGSILTAFVLIQISRALMTLLPTVKESAASFYFVIIDALLAVCGLLGGVIWLVVFTTG